MSEEKLYTLPDAHLAFAKSTFNSIWGLLEKEGRTPQEDLDMLLAAHASLFHWKIAGTVVNEQRGCWMISRVYQTLGRAAGALEWALRCQELTQNDPEKMEDFDLAYAQEGLARAYALSGDLDLAQEHWSQAASLGEMIKDQEDREIFTADLQGGNWYQLGIDHP